MSASTTMAEARRRHPSARWPAPLDQLRVRVAQWLELGGVGHADVAARLLEVRGRTGLDVEAFARRLGTDPQLRRQAEAGEVPRSRLPGKLARMVA